MFFLSANGARLRRNAGFAVALLLAVAGLLISAAPARADCAPGMVPTVDDMCMEEGNMDCGVGRGSCAPGTVCMRGHGCMPVGSVDCGDETYTSPGGSCKASAPPASTTATNPPGSCSTITGPGMPSGPANCPPNQPRPVTTVPPPTQTVAPPAPAPLNPIDPATLAAQQLFQLLNIPVPQPQPTTPDRETQARAAFDQGQAAYNAHDCATALQYFNQAVSLTVSYGSTYAGWRDRAQQCAGQVPTASPGTPAPQPPAVSQADREQANRWLQMAKEIEGRKNQSCFDWDEAITYYENSDAIYRRSGDPGLLALAQSGESRVAQLKQYLHVNFPDAVGIGYACNQRGTPGGGIPPGGGTPPSPDRCAKFGTVISQASDDVAMNGGDISSIKATVRAQGCVWKPTLAACLRINLGNLSDAEKAARRSMLECQ